MIAEQISRGAAIQVTQGNMPFYRKQILAEIVTKKLRTFRDPACILPSLDIVTPDSIQAVSIGSTVVVDDIPLFNENTFTTGVVSNVGGNRSTASADMSVIHSGKDEASFTTDATTFINQPASNGCTASTIGADSASATRVNVLDMLTRDQGEKWSSPFFFQNKDGDPPIKLVVGFRFPLTIKPDTQGGKTFSDRQNASSLIEMIDRSTRTNSHFECCVKYSQQDKKIISIGCKKSRCYYQNLGAVATALKKITNAKSNIMVAPGDSEDEDVAPAHVILKAAPKESFTSGCIVTLTFRNDDDELGLTLEGSSETDHGAVLVMEVAAQVCVISAAASATT